ncbi:M42 family metallopeptidase [Thalassobacillus hwangdonensis]|uniref:M42 family metallopeptidase n=1 Tax=Thalassobacillus hwangdonensis TaxID=546108 RepID=A0ABW3KYK7_9BACI
MQKHINHIVNYIEQLTSIPSPSGYTDLIMNYCENILNVKGVQASFTNKGALIATVEGEDNKNHRMLTAHLDALGAMVKEITPDGKLKMSMVGGFAWNSIEGEYCKIHTMNEGDLTGTILLENPSVHVNREVRKCERTDQNIVVRLDEVVHSREDVEKLGIQVGDFVSFDPRYQMTESGYVKSRHLDDKASAAIMLHMIETIVEESIKLPYTTHFYFSNNEEIGFGANASIPEQTVEYLAIDMGALGKGQASTEHHVSICAKDSSGPYHLGLKNSLVKLSVENGVDYKVDIYPYYGSDASAAIRAGYDIKHGLVGPGIDASHSMERTHTDSLWNTYQLLMAYLKSPLV